MMIPTSSGRESSSGSNPAALLTLLRPANGVMAGAAVLVGAFVSAHHVDWRSAGLGALAAFAAAGAANALNDARDVDSDRINRPARPVPSGLVGPATAVAIAVGLYAASVALACPLGAGAVLIVAAWVVSTVLYSFALKGVPLFGNLVVAGVAASPLLMGGLTQGVSPALARGAAVGLAAAGDTAAAPHGHGLVVLFALAVLLHLARELVKDAEDLEGDRAAGTSTFAVAAGLRPTLAAARVLLVVSMWAAVAPFAMRVMGWGYLALLVPIEGALAWLLIQSSHAISGDDRVAALGRLSNGLKAVMVLGLAAFAAGAV